MQIPINVDQLQAVQAIGSGSPIGSIAFKLGNTPAFDFYFASGATVQDFGSGTAIRFGMCLGQNAAAGSLLVDEITFTRMLDDSNRVFYRGFPNFDTDLLIAALADKYSIQCSGEVRWQKPDGSIDRTLDIPFQIIRPIIPETTATSPSIPDPFPDPSTLIPVSQKGEPLGIATLDADGLLEIAQLPPVPLAEIPSGVELTAHRNTNGGYPGLDSQGLVPAGAVPVDGSTVLVTSATITRTGTTASGSAIITGLSSTSDLTLLQPVAASGIPGGATLLSIDGPSQITISANATASAAVSITFTTLKLSAVGPAQGVLSITASDFTVPTVGATVPINTPTTNLTPGLFYTLSGGAGSYQFVSATDLTHGVFRNLGGSANAPATTVISFPVNVQWSGPPGAGSGGGILCEVTTAVTLPATGTNVNVEVDDGDPFASIAGVCAIVVPGSTTQYGYWFVQAVDATHVNVANDARWPAANAGTTLPVGARIILIDIFQGVTFPPTVLNGFIEAPTAKSYTLQLLSPGGQTIFNFSVKTLSGTCTADVKKNGTVITGLSGIAVTSTLTTIGFLSVAVATADLLELVISSPSSPVDLAYSMTLTN